MPNTFFDLIEDSNLKFSDIKQYCTKKSVKSHEILLNEGDVANACFIVEKGILRLWNNYEGKDITVQFFFEGQGVSSFESLYLNEPSKFSIDALEDSNVYVLNKANLNLLITQYPEIENLITKQIAHRFIAYTNYFLSRIKDKPEDRYKALIQAEGDNMRRVLDHYIASYLGITSVSLSRIKKRIYDSKR